MGGGGGTEAFPDLGRHCQHPECRQLDFLPFTCAGCSEVFCVEHRSYKSHDCPKLDHGNRTVVICEVCSTSVETTGCDEEGVKALLKKHEESRDCDPRKKKKPTCAVRRCKEVLTFSNTITCKTCQLKVCMNHRFPADHACKESASPVAAAAVPNVRPGDKFLAALAARNGKECNKNARSSASSTPSISVH